MSRSFGVRSLTTSSPISNSPSVISSSPAIIRSAVDFPQPDGPTRIMNSPSAISRFTCLTASVPSRYRFVTSLRTISAMTTRWLYHSRRESVVSVDREPAPAALVREHAGPCVEEAQLRPEPPPQCYQAPVMLEQRARVAPLALDVPLLRIDGREPGPA